MSLIITEQDMSNNFETDWIRIIKYDNKLKTLKKLKSIQIKYRDLAFNSPVPIGGEIIFHYSNHYDFISILDTVAINTNNQSTNTLIYYVRPNFNFIKVKFEKNDIVSGFISLAAGYDI